MSVNKVNRADGKWITGVQIAGVEETGGGNSERACDSLFGWSLTS